MPATIIDLLARAAVEFSNVPVTCYQGRTTTYGELWARSRRLGGALRSFRLADRERVLYIGRSSDRLVEIVMGASMANHPCIVPEPGLSLAALMRFVRDQRITTLFADCEHADTGRTLAARWPLITRLVTIDCADRVDDELEVDHDWLVEESEPINAFRTALQEYFFQEGDVTYTHADYLVRLACLKPRVGDAADGQGFACNRGLDEALLDLVRNVSELAKRSRCLRSSFIRQDEPACVLS